MPDKFGNILFADEVRETARQLSTGFADGTLERDTVANIRLYVDTFAVLVSEGVEAAKEYYYSIVDPVI